jgi:hypothetical protein
MDHAANRFARLGFILAAWLSAPLQAADPMLQSRPCGPDSLTGPLRLLIPQGAFGADFRPACRSHDACYDTPGADRAVCDRRYLEAMECACERSRHPVLCRMAARAMYRATSRHGEESFRSAQSIALQKLAVAGE